MARPLKTGLDYFPLDVDLFEDDKVQLISAEFGIEGELIYVRLLCKIYKNGYHYKWGADECLLFAKSIGNGVSVSSVENVVIGCVNRGLFAKNVFEKYGILTSTGIQERYQSICKQLKRSFEIDKKIDCRRLTLLKNEFTPEINQFPPEETPLIPAKSTQIEKKRKEIKVKEMKGCTVENEIWVDQTSMFTKVDKRALIDFCNSWIIKAELQMKFNTYEVPALVSFMVSDLDTKKDTLPQAKTRRDQSTFWEYWQYEEYCKKNGFEPEPQK